jgi:putative transposase
MLWARLLDYVTGTVNQELLLRNEYLAAEKRILRGHIKGRLLLSEGKKVTLAEIAHRLVEWLWRRRRQRPSPIRF